MAGVSARNLLDLSITGPRWPDLYGALPPMARIRFAFLAPYLFVCQVAGFCLLLPMAEDLVCDTVS